MTHPCIWSLRCFGALHARRDQQHIDKFRTQKTAALLALLALRGSQQREAVCALLWPDAPPEAARNSLSAALSALRRDLGDELVCADRQSVALAPGAVETDVRAFDDALKANDYARAVELYRGPLLPGFHDDPFPALANEYQEKARVAFGARLEELENNGECGALLELARRAIALFGDDERWFLALMRAHYGLGDFDAALRAYESLGRWARKNGDSASQSARLLAKMIRRDRENQAATANLRDLPTPVIADAAPRHNLPALWTRFFGREAERDLLRDWLQGGENLVTLSGAGGSGKTRLALETLRELAAEFDGDIAFVSLAALSDAELIFSAIRDALPAAPAPDGTPLDQIERVLRGRRAILFLDNFEQLVEGGAAHLQTLRERLPAVAFLVTSRVLLQLPGEREFPVAPLPTPLHNLAVSQIGECASAALFCDRAALHLDETNAESIGALCRRLDGIPLALELAAARAKVLSPAQITERLGKHPDFLQSRELGVPARHKTLRATIEWSTDLLPPALRAFWTRLALFHGGWSLEAAENIAAPGICENYETLDFLTQLRECSLIFVAEQGGTTRFRMLQTLREFGREQLEDSEEVERAYFDFFLELAQQAANAMQGPQQTAWLARLDDEEDNLRAALSWAREHDAARGLQLATALIDFWETRLSLDEGRGWIESFLRATQSRETATPEQARALSGAGRLAWYAADFPGAEALLQQGLEAARQGDDVAALIYSTHSAARLAAVVGENQKAQQLGRESVALARESGARAPLLAALVDLGPAFIVGGDFVALHQVCEEAIALARAEGDGHALAVALYMDAIGHYYQGQFDRARPLLDESQRLCRELNSRWDLMICLGTLGSVAREQGEMEAARQAFHQTISICREAALHDHNVLSMLLATSYWLAKSGRHREAAQLMGACQAFHETLGIQLMAIMAPDDARYRELVRAQLGEAELARQWQMGRALTPAQTLDYAIDATAGASADAAQLAARARALSGAGRLAWYASDMTSANARLEEGLQAARAAGDQSTLIYATRTLARVAAVGGEAQRALELGRESVALARAAGANSALLESLMDLAFAEFNAGDFESAERNAREALALARSGGEQSTLALALTLMACVCEMQDRLDEALAWVEESEALCRRLGVQWELMVCLGMQGQLWSKRGDFARAQNFSNQALAICRGPLLSTWHAVTTLLSVSSAWMRRGDARGAAQLMGAIDALSEAIGYTMMPALVPEQQQFERAAREQLGEAEFEKLWKRGRAMSPEAAIDFAMNSAPAEAPLVEDSIRARALSGAGRLAWHDSDFAASRELVLQGLDAARKSGDAASFVYAVAAFVRMTSIGGDIEGDIAQGRRLAETAVQRARAEGDETLLAEALMALAYAAVMVDELAGMREVHREAIELSRRLGDDRQLATALISLSTLAYREAQFDEARALLAEATPLCRRLDAPFLLFASLWGESNVAREAGDLARAGNAIGEAIALCRDNAAFRWNACNGLLTASYLMIKRGDAAGAVQLMSAAQELGAQVGYQLVPLLRRDADRYKTAAHAILGATDFESAWQKGRALTLAQALDLAVTPARPPTDEALATRSRALAGAARLAWHGSDIEASRALATEGLDAACASGDTASFVHSVAAFVRYAMATGDIEGAMTRARELSEEAVQRARRAANEALLLEALVSLGYALCVIRELDSTFEVTVEAIALARALSDEINLVRALTLQASVHYHQNRYAPARVLLAQSDPICRRLNSPWDLVATQWVLSHVAREQGELEVAGRALNESLEIQRAHPAFSWSLANALLSASYLRVARDQPADAAQLMGVAARLWEDSGYRITPVQRAEDARYHALARQQLGAAAFEESWQAGRALSSDAAMELALQNSVLADESLLATRSRALSGAARLAYSNDLAASRELVSQGLEAARASGDISSFVYAVAAFVRLAMTTGDEHGLIAQSQTLSQQAVARSRSADNHALLLDALLSLGYAQTIVGELEAGLRAGEEALQLARELDDNIQLARILNLLGNVHLHARNYVVARVLLAESEPICRRLRLPGDLISALWTTSTVAREQGELEVAIAALNEVLEICQANPAFRWGLANVLDSMAYLKIERGQTRHAAQLMGAAQKSRDETGYQTIPVLRAERDRYLAQAQQQLGDTAFEAAWQAGRALTKEAAMELAMQE